MILVMPITAPFAPPGEIQQIHSFKPFGFFSNEKSSDGEHSGGFTLHVWDSPKGLYILLWVHEGLIGDGSPLRAVDVFFDPKSTRLTFRAEQSKGQFIRFSGSLTNGVAKGTFRFPSGFIANGQVMARCCDDAKKKRSYSSLEALEKDWIHEQ